jgi:hypothetical protein
MPQLRRIYWGRHNGRGRYTFHSRYINHQSVILITASEGDEGNSTASPQRFVGAANFRVENIAPFDGGVVFVVTIDWDHPLPLWTEVVMQDRYPQGFIR